MAADTGSPWNLPYPEGTDLVRNGATDIQNLAENVATSLSTIAVAGIGSNVASDTKVDTFTTTSTAFVPVTGLSVTITPTSATSKILVVAQISASIDVTNQIANFNLVRDSTNLLQSTGGSSRNSTLSIGQIASTSMIMGYVISFLDSPATTSAVTYSIETSCTGAGAVYVNRRGASDTEGATSTITAIEVAA